MSFVQTQQNSDCFAYFGYLVLERSFFCHNYFLISIMNYIKDIFLKGRYHLYIGFTIFIEGQRRYLLPHSNLYKHLRKTVTQELRVSDPDRDTTNLKLEDMTPQQLNHLKTVTKRKVDEIQNMSSDQYATLPISFTILGLGSINYFLSPTICAIFVAGYLTLLAADYAKSISVLKFGMDPLWRWKMKDMGYVVACCFGALTFAVVARSGISKLKQRASKEIVVKKLEDVPSKKQ